MQPPAAFTRIPALKSAAEFRRRVAVLGLDLPCDDAVLERAASPLAQPLSEVTINGKTIGNRWAIQPMEGWDGTASGGVTDEVRRRWRRFGESGAKLIWGGEAMAVCPAGRANPRQLLITDAQQEGLAELREGLARAHRDRFGRAEDLVIGFQLTHSGRFCKPVRADQPEPRAAYRHPLLDDRFHVISEAQVIADAELPRLVADYVRAARIAREAGADFVDLKHCHGYLLHEFLSAFTRPGPYGGTFENRTRLFREIVEGIRGSGNRIELGVRLSAFDSVPYRPDPGRSAPGRPGPGIPEDYSACLPYRYAFGVSPANPLEPDLAETHRFLQLCATLGVKLVNLTAGSPYYNPHLQRPAAYPPSDGYQPPEDPLAGVARQVQAVRRLKAQAPAGLVVVGSAYSYLQEYLPHVAQAVVRQGWTDAVGMGRMALSYPTLIADSLATGAVNPRLLCRTFSDCTTAPRNGLISGCYPLDPYYGGTPEAGRLKAVKRARGGSGPPPN